MPYDTLCITAIQDAIGVHRKDLLGEMYQGPQQILNLKNIIWNCCINIK